MGRKIKLLRPVGLCLGRMIDVALLRIEHDGVETIVLRQSLSNIVLSVDQIQSVIKTLELAALEIRHANDLERDGDAKAEVKHPAT